MRSHQSPQPPEARHRHVHDGSVRGGPSGTSRHRSSGVLDRRSRGGERTVDIDEDEATCSSSGSGERGSAARARREFTIDVGEDEGGVLPGLGGATMWGQDPLVRATRRSPHPARLRSDPPSPRRRPPKIADQVRRGRRLDSANPRQPPRSASVQPPEEMSGEEPGGEGGGHESPDGSSTVESGDGDGSCWSSILPGVAHWLCSGVGDSLAAVRSSLGGAGEDPFGSACPSIGSPFVPVLVSCMCRYFTGLRQLEHPVGEDQVRVGQGHAVGELPSFVQSIDLAPPEARTELPLGDPPQ